ncbi:MAG: hypothetical protein LBG31_02620 [Prevotellaceae bacterium]|nr:hypothetical protein [Prevotellaceae bacterium]
MVSSTRGSQTWSAPVTATYCDKSSYNGGASDNGYVSDCRNNVLLTYGHLFSWCMVKTYAHTLCPTPWRAPSFEDFENLCYIAYGRDDSYACYDFPDAFISTAWGGLLGGYARNGHVSDQNENGFWWSSTWYRLPSHDAAYSVRQYRGTSTARLEPQGTEYGYSLRCVQD